MNSEQTGASKLTAQCAEGRNKNMLHDATIEVTCDGCSSAITIEPEFVYRDYSGKNGYYDTSDDAIEAKLVIEGWEVLDGKHYCEACKSAPKPE
jgi:hypothetical protein